MSNSYELQFVNHAKDKRNRVDIKLEPIKGRTINKLLICEGIDDVFFFDKCCNDMGASNLQILPLHGGLETCALKLIRQKFGDVQIALCLDSDDTPQERMTKAQKIINTFHESSQFIGTIQYFQIPAKDQCGSIETLILQTVTEEHQKEYYYKQLSEDATDKAFTYWNDNNLCGEKTTNNKDKRKIQCYLSLHHDKMYYGPGRAFAEGRFGSICDSAPLEKIKLFLEKFLSPYKNGG